jgi:hypothetical protein
MTQYIVNTIVKDGHVEINDLPFPNLSRIKVLLLPEIDIKEMSFFKAQELTKEIKGNLSDEIDFERGER